MEKLIMLVSNDKYELPIAIANSANEMSRIIGLQENSIKKALYENRVNRKYNGRFISVEVKNERLDGK